MSRSDAKLVGAKRYFTGLPCTAGHVAERSVSNKTCLVCAARRPKSETTKAKQAARGAKWYADNRERELQRRKKNYRDALEDRLKKGLEYRATRKHEQASRRRAHYEANAHRYKAQAVARREHIRIATPPWVDHEAIATLYERSENLTKESGIQHHVDHFYPLRGKSVCGLHVAENLRVIESRVNLSKGNRFP